MATKSLVEARYHSGPHKVLSLPEAASQTFKAGQFVYLVSGKVTVVASDGTVIFGQALIDASGTEDTAILVLVPTNQTLFIMNVYHATLASGLTQPNEKIICPIVIASFVLSGACLVSLFGFSRQKNNNCLCPFSVSKYQLSVSVR